MWVDEVRNPIKILVFTLIILIIYVPVIDCKPSGQVGEVTISKGDIYTITLNENPSTGFTWSITSSDGLEIFSQKLTPSTKSSTENIKISEVKLRPLENTGKKTEAQNTEFTVSVIPSDGLKILSEKLTPPSKNCSSGTTGTREVKFEAVKTGKQTIEGKYQQPWKKLPIQSFRIIFNVV